MITRGLWTEHLLWTLRHFACLWCSTGFILVSVVHGANPRNEVKRHQQNLVAGAMPEVTFGVFAPTENLLGSITSFRIIIVETPPTERLNLNNLKDQANDVTRDDGSVSRLLVTFRL